MTITIADGRGALWQWDTGRRLRVGSGVEQIHYQNRALGRSVDVDVGEDGTAIIPDELLQDCHTLTAYAYVTDDTGAYTMVQQDFIVHKRAKPAGYVYTPTDQITLQTIQRQIGDIAALTTEAKENLVAAINEAAASCGAGSMDLRVADGYVQYSSDGGMTWTNLIAMADLKGADGAQGGTDMGITGATVGQIAKITAVDASGVPTAWSPVDMPEALPNPNALTFTGAVTGSYDGSAPVSVEIPSGGGGSDTWETIIDFELTEDVGSVTFTTDISGNPFSLKEFTIFVVQTPIVGQTENYRLAFAPNKNRWGDAGNVELRPAPKETDETVYSFIHANTVDGRLNLLTSVVSSNYSSVRGILSESTHRNNYSGSFTIKVNETTNELKYCEMPLKKINFVGIGPIILGTGSKIVVRGIRK